MEFINLKEQYRRIEPLIKAGIDKVIQHGQYILGPEVHELEERLAAYVGVKHCISCANGTDALQIAYMALGVTNGDSVVTPGFTYIATAEAAAIIGARINYIDIDKDSYNLDPDLLDSAYKPDVKAIVPVSLYGQCADFDRINEWASIKKLPVIEDAAQSFGAMYKGKRSCSLSTVACTSFFPSKPLGCYGDGGAIFTNDDDLAKILRQIARHGQEKRYVHVRVGMNSRLDTIQAAILLAKLSVFDSEIELRQSIAEGYDKKLKNIDGIVTPKVASYNTSVYGQYTVRVTNRDQIIKYLGGKGIPTAVHYPIPLNKQQAVRCDEAQLPNGDLASQEVLSLPFSPYLTDSEQDAVVQALGDALTATRISEA